MAIDMVEGAQYGAVYRITDTDVMEMLLKKFPDTCVIEDLADGVVKITGDEFIERAVAVGAIEAVVNDGDLIVIGSPSELIPYITASERRVYDDNHTEYTIITKRGTFMINGKSLMHGNTWLDNTLEGCNILMNFTMRQQGMKQELIKLVKHVHNDAITVDIGETISQTKAGIIMEQMYPWQTVGDREDFVGHYVLDMDGMYHVRASILGDVVRGLGYEFPGTMHKILKGYIAKPSSRVTVSGTRIGVWRFKPWNRGDNDE